jgi:uncharacterized protein
MNSRLHDKLWTHVREKLPKYGCHGFEHTERVYKLCEKIGNQLKVKMNVLLPAAILHDIARGEPNHALNGSKMAERILSEYDVPQSTREQIVHAIVTHRFSEKLKPRTVEAMILSDSDKLDAIGAVGIYRAAAFSSEVGRPIEDFIDHFHEKLLELKDLLYTDEAKILAQERHEFMQKYLEQIKTELDFS